MLHSTIFSFLIFAMFQTTAPAPVSAEQMEKYIAVAVAIVSVFVLLIVLMAGIILNQRKLIHQLANDLMAAKMKKTPAENNEQQ